MQIVEEVHYLDNKKIYCQWNGKNIDGQVELNNTVLLNEAVNSNTPEMKCVVGVDTFSADELQ